MDKIQLKASKRDEKGGTINKIRKQGMMPAVLYGYKVENTPLVLNANEFEKVLRKAGESTIIDLATDDGKTHSVLIHDIQYHGVKGHPLHADFYEVNMTEKLKAMIALEFVGESNAVKALGGTLVKVLNEIEVECLPADLPHNLEVDISVLNTFADTIHVRDIKLPTRVETVTDPEETVAKIQEPRDVEAELAAPVEENVEAVIEASTEKPAEGEEPAAEGEEKKE